MILKFQTPVPSEQPNITKGGLATMQMPIGPRIGVLYVEASVVAAATGAATVSMPVITDIIDSKLPIFIKHNGRPLVQRLVSELLLVDNKLQDAGLSTFGSVAYYQDAGGGLAATPENLVCRVADAANTSATVLSTALTNNKATLAVFQIPVYFAQMFRKDIGTGEDLSLPTAFAGGLVSAPITAEVPVANLTNSTGPGTTALSAWSIKFHYDFDGLTWPLAADGTPRSSVVKRGRFTKTYAAAGDLSIQIPQKDALMQFVVLLAAGDKWSKLIVRKNGTTLKEITPDRMFQSLLDHQLNAAAMAANMIPVIFDLNDDLNARLPLQTNDTIEIVATLTTVQAAAQAVVLTEYLGLAD